MNKREVIEQLAKERRVEHLVQVICKVTSPILSDFAQMIYLALLEYDEHRIVDIYESGQINFFLVRIIKNQWLSTTSPFYHLMRKFGRRSDEMMTYNETADNY